PTAPGIELTPAIPATLDDLLCTVTTPSTVGEALPAAYEYVWTSSDVTVTHGPTSAGTDTLSYVRSVKYDTWNCAVRCWDGYDYSAPGNDAVVIVNTPPGVPVVYLPSGQSTSANLICEVQNLSTDPDFDAITYLYDWEVWRNAGTGFEAFTGAVDAGTLSIVDTLHTSAGDLWRCTVTPDDGDDTGESVLVGNCEIVSGGVEESFITLAVTGNNPITLGQPTTISGSIVRPGAGGDPPPTIVSFNSIAPTGGTLIGYPESLAISTGSFSRTFYPNVASEGYAAWQVASSWPGDATYQGAASSNISYVVLKAQPELAISISPTSALLNLEGAEDLTIEVMLSVPDFAAELRPLLTGLPVRLSAATPGGQTPFDTLEAVTDASGKAVFTAQAFRDSWDPV
ncbi:MAG: hypothetical protein GY851_20480, partial [bacterium]|nr:hypothetical protein [bacterium]